MQSIVAAIRVAVVAGIIAALTYIILSQADQTAELSTSLEALERRINQLEIAAKVRLAQTPPSETPRPLSPEPEVETPDQEPATLFRSGPAGFTVMQQLRDPSIDPEILIRETP